MHPRVAMFLQERANARARGDRGVERCMNVELRRMGYVDPVETTVAEPMEQVVPPPKRRGREPKPKCEHGRPPERCLDCQED